jgi:trimethylamine--corrinoid protein Co-methyltransferase
MTPQTADTVRTARLALSFAGPDIIREIHAATLEVLARVGVCVRHLEALDLLRKAGAYVDADRAFIPERLVRDALHTAPSYVTLYDRQGEPSLALRRGGPSYYGPGSDLPFTIDLETGERRQSAKADVIAVARLVDALPNLDFMMSSAIARDTPDGLSYLHQYDAMVGNTVKPIILTARDERDLRVMFGISASIAGGKDGLRRKPAIAVYAEPISPLVHSEEGTAKLLLCADFGVPAVYTPGNGAGMNCPVTSAGLLVQENAELLSGLVIHQLRAPGAPFIYGGCPSIGDMRTMIFPYGCPEWHMNSVLLCELARHYDLPVFSTGGCSDAMSFDQQAGIEAGFSILLAELSGANLVHDVGYLGSGLINSLESLVACDETIGLVRRTTRGIVVDRGHLALEAIARVGPGGNYILDEHTAAHFRDEMWMPDIMNRKRYDDWKGQGGKSLGEVARDKARRILQEHSPAALPREVQERIAESLARFERPSAAPLTTSSSTPLFNK